MLTTALVAAAFVTGIAGTWSPCGLSMIATINGPRRRVWLCCMTFALGALAGGTVTFGGLAVLGSLVGARGLVFVPVLGVAAAIADVRGLPIVPQIRRQVPEHWRRMLPLPAATLLYGVLLGLGFTTFVYAVALWALAGIAFVVASPQTGALVGLAFGAGRALPICAIAPVAHCRAGRSLVDAAASRALVGGPTSRGRLPDRGRGLGARGRRGRRDSRPRDGSERVRHHGRVDVADRRRCPGRTDERNEERARTCRRRWLAHRVA